MKVKIPVKLATGKLAIDFPGDYQTLIDQYRPYFLVEPGVAIWHHIADLDARRSDSDQWDSELVRHIISELLETGHNYHSLLGAINSPGFAIHAIDPVLEVKL